MRKLALLLLVFLLGSCKQGEHLYNGYIDVDLTYLSSNFPGRLKDLFVSRGETVHKNQVLFKLEQTGENNSITMSQLTRSSLISQKNAILDQINYAKINYLRTQRMKKQNAASQGDLDLAKRDLDVLSNQLASIKFQIEQGEVDIANKKWETTRKENISTEEGLIFDTYFNQNEYISAGQPVLSLITKQHIKVIFFVPENELSQVALNQNIRLSRDGDLAAMTGHVRYISNIAQYTPPMIFSREERQKLVFRVEADLDNPDLTQIHLGQPVTLELVK